MKFSRILALLSVTLIIALPAAAQDASDDLGENPFEGMSREQRREAFDKLSEAERDQIRERIRNKPGGMRTMTPEQREQMRRRFESMTPEQRDQFRDRMQKRRESMTPDQREQMRERQGSQGQRDSRNRGGKRGDI